MIEVQQEDVQRYIKHILELPYPVSAENLLSIAKQFNIPAILAQNIVECIIDDMERSGLLQPFPLPTGYKCDGSGSYATINNLKIYTHPPEDDLYLSRLLLHGLKHEDAESDYISHLIRPGYNIIDVGANIGINTLKYARMVGSNGRVIAIEPESNNYRLLNLNIESNGFRDNVTTYSCALSDSIGQTCLYINPTNRGDHRMWSFSRRENVVVPCRTLDSLEINHPIHMIKIDVQGAEADVLKGASKLIASANNLILNVEYWPTGLHAMGCSPSSFNDLIKDLGFSRILCINEKNKEPVVYNSIVDCIPEYSNHFIDLICIKGFM